MLAVRLTRHHPLRIAIGQKTPEQGSVEVKRRHEAEQTLVPTAKLIEFLRQAVWAMSVSRRRIVAKTNRLLP